MVAAMGLRSDCDDARALVVVEGVSDQVAIEALAERRGIDLAGARIRVVALGGAHRIGRFLEELGPRSDGLRLAGLCDAGEAPVFRRALERTGLGSDLSREEMEQLGFYVCVADLEDELIRALGVAAVEEIVRANGDLQRFRKLQQMPAWRSRAPTNSFGGSSASARAARSAMPASWSMPSISSVSLDHSTGSWSMLPGISGAYRRAEPLASQPLQRNDPLDTALLRRTERPSDLRQTEIA